MTALSHSKYMTIRHLKSLARQPWYVAVSLVQPVIWLLLFGSLFGSVAQLPGFEATAYLDFLAPGIVIMNAIMSGGWGGIGMYADLERGVMNRFLVAPTSRASLIAGPLIQQALVIALQSFVITGLALLLGARFAGGAVGLIVLFLCAMLIGAALAALSNALVLLTRKEEVLVILVQALALPLTFLSTVFMPAGLVPGWIGAVARFNPANWAVVAGREALNASPDWGIVLAHNGYLLVFAVVCAWLATHSFRAYQRSQ
jgi:ABC-2 type transport system permease protein